MVAFSLTLLGRYDEALEHVHDALRMLRGATHPQHILNATFVAGGLAQHRLAVSLAAWAVRACEDEVMMVQAIDRRLLEQLEADARATLGDDGYGAAVREGEAMTVDQAVELILSLTADA